MEFDSSPNRSARRVGLRPVPHHPSPLLKAYLSPQVRRSLLNPNGIVSSSPGLRAASYPGCAAGGWVNPEWVAPFILLMAINPTPLIAARRREWTDGGGDATLTGLAVFFDAHTQGSSRLATLGWRLQSRWD